LVLDFAVLALAELGRRNSVNKTKVNRCGELEVGQKYLMVQPPIKAQPRTTLQQLGV
jgi:hypothetical protein